MMARGIATAKVCKTNVQPRWFYGSNRSKAFGVKLDALLRIQVSYDIARTRERGRQIHVQRICQPSA
jgi:hypothetical protein